MLFRFAERAKESAFYGARGFTEPGLSVAHTVELENVDVLEPLLRDKRHEVFQEIVANALAEGVGDERFLPSRIDPKRPDMVKALVSPIVFLLQRP